MQQKTSTIAGIPIGKEHPVRIAAEIGTYFGTDIGLAKEYVAVAKEAGAEFLKTEILHDLSVIWDDTMTHTYQTDAGPKTENYRSLLSRKLVPLAEYRTLIRYCREQNMPVIASVYDFAGVDFMVAEGGAAVKVASQNMTNRPLIEHCAKSGLPFLMDTGNSLLHEVAAALHWAESCGCENIVINHRPDGNPCPAQTHNLRLLQSYADTFGWPVGLACHYDGDEMIYLAIGLGARFIEKPLYHKKVRDDQDTMFTMTYDAFREMARKVRNCSLALGDGVRRTLIPGQLECRACIVAKNDLPAGSRLSTENVVFAWPAKGIPAALWHEVEGALTLRPVEAARPLQWGDIHKEK